MHVLSKIAKSFSSQTADFVHAILMLLKLLLFSEEIFCRNPLFIDVSVDFIEKSI